MKSLAISLTHALLAPNQYGVSADSVDISKLIRENLPKDMENYKDYPVNIVIEIDIFDKKPVIETKGYTIESDPLEAETEPKKEMEGPF